MKKKKLIGLLAGAVVLSLSILFIGKWLIGITLMVMRNPLFTFKVFIVAVVLEAFVVSRCVDIADSTSFFCMFLAKLLTLGSTAFFWYVFMGIDQSLYSYIPQQQFRDHADLVLSIFTLIGVFLAIIALAVKMTIQYFMLRFFGVLVERKKLIWAIELANVVSYSMMVWVIHIKGYSYGFLAAF